MPMLAPNTPQLGPGDRDFTVLENVAYRQFRKIGLDEDEARSEAESAAYLLAESLANRVDENL